MKASKPTLSPRHEAFCRHVARGASLASAAREAGYAPSSARQRGSELYARDDVQQRIGQLTAEHAQAEDEMREDYLGRLQMVFEECMAHGERGTALRALTVQLQLRGLDARSLTRRAEAEREREAQADELRDHLRAELYAEIRAEVLGGLEQRKQPQKPARAERTMTNHDVRAKSAGPASSPDASSGRPGLPAFDREGQRAAPLLVKVEAGLAGRRGRRAWLDDATLPCLDGAALGHAPGTESLRR